MPEQDGVGKDAVASSRSLRLYRATLYCLLAMVAYTSLSWFGGYSTAVEILDGIRLEGATQSPRAGGILSTEFVPGWVRHEVYYAVVAVVASVLAFLILVVTDLRGLFKRRTPH
jgi:hypothetical protein